MERKWKALLVGLIILALMGGPTIAYQCGRNSLLPELQQTGNRKQELEQELQQVQEQIQELEQDLEQAQERIQELERELEQARNPWKNVSLRIYLHLPREVNQTGYLQHIKNFTLAFDIVPSGITLVTDEDGNNYTVIYWNEEQNTKITVYIEAIVFRKVNTNILVDTSPHLYPILEDLIPNDTKSYLKPTLLSQSDDSTIIEQAKAIAGNLTNQSEIVNATILWVYQNVEWKCSADILEEYGFLWSDAVNTLRYRVGVCNNFANLAIALLRALGIPARYVQGFVANHAPTLKEALSGHAWVQVYYPKAGWINYDPTKGMVHLPQHIEFIVKADQILGYEVANADFTEEWYAVGLENNTVKIKYTVAVSPKEAEE